MRRLVAACVLAALLAPGCRRPPPRPQQGQATKLRVNLRRVLSHAPIVIAEREGYFRKQGLEVELAELGRNHDAIPALLEGKLDVAAGLVHPAYFSAIARGGRLRIVANKGYLDPEGCTYAAFIARPGLLRGGRLLRPGPAKRWRVGLRRGSVGEFLLDRALRADGIPAEEAEIAYLPDAAEVEALRKQAADVVLAFGGGVERCLRSGAGAVWHTAHTLAPDFPLLVVLYGRSLLDEDPDAGRRFMAAYLQGVRQYNEGKTERNLEILGRRLGLDRATLLASCWVPVREDGRVGAQQLLEFQAWAQARGFLERRLAVEEFWEPRFVELAARELVAPAGRAAAAP